MLPESTKSLFTMPSKLNKVQKHVNKKKGNKVNTLHENSRDAKRLRNAGARDERVARTTATREKVNRQWLDRVAFFQDKLPETLHPLDVVAIQELVGQFLNRHEDELVALKQERRPGRPPSNRQALLEQQLKIEAQEYESGFWMPDLRDVETLEKLDAWKGEWLGLGNLRFVRVEQNGHVKESQFPPRGAS